MARQHIPNKAYVHIGILRWMFENPSRSTTPEQYVLQFDQQHQQDGLLPAAQSVLRAANADVTLDDIEALGKEAAAYRSGCNTRGSTKYVQLVDSAAVLQIRFYRKPTKGWDEVDARYVSSVGENEEKRYTRIARWINNSCGPSSALFVAIMLGVGRIRYDQLSPPEMVALDRPAAKLRQIVCSSLSSCTNRQVEQLREELRVDLQTHDSTLFGIGNFTSVNDLLMVLLTSVPQVSWVEVTCYTCCDGIFTVLLQENGTLKGHSEFNRVEVTRISDSLTAWLNHHWASRPASHCPELGPCTNGNACTRVRARRRAVVDRLPPVLTLAFGGPYKRTECQSLGLFDDVTVGTVNHVGDHAQTTYRVQGAIFHLPGIGHFITRWFRHNQIVQYDDLKSANVSPIGSTTATNGDIPSELNWFRGLGKDAGLIVMFFRQTDII